MTCSRVAYCGWPGVPTKISPQIGQGRPILERTSECCCFVLFFRFFMVSPQVIPHTSLPHDVNHRGLRLLPQHVFLRLRVYKLQLSRFREVIRVNPTYLLLHIWRQYWYPPPRFHPRNQENSRVLAAVSKLHSR